MKPTTALFAAAAALTLPAAASAIPVTLTTQIRSYSGEPVYLVLYLTDASGKYVQTLHLAGGKSRYWGSLQAWYAATGGAGAEINGVTGASVGAGRTLKVTVDIADTLIDAGYQIRIDTAVEHMGQVPADVAVPLTTAGAGQAVAGRGFVNSFDFDL